jgi:DNA-directed RNA polymerase specialized sigma24 family protein
MSTWLTTVVRNCALMQLRKRHRQILLFADGQSKTSNRTLYGKDSRTVDPARKTSIEIPS